MQHFKADGSSLDTLQYLYTDSSNLYDPTGRLHREVDAGGRTHVFTYNNLYELTAESHPDFTPHGYVYDLNGNRTQKTGTAAHWCGYDAQNKLLWLNTATALPASRCGSSTGT